MKLEAADYGFISGLTFVSLLSALGAAGNLLADLDVDPSPELLRTMAGIGASFFLAYVIEATWMATKPKFMRNNSTEGDAFMGFVTGLAVAGLAGVVIALILSDNRPMNREFLREFTLWWSIVALVSLGFMVAMQPTLAHVWTSRLQSEAGDGGTGD